MTECTQTQLGFQAYGSLQVTAQFDVSFRQACVTAVERA